MGTIADLVIRLSANTAAAEKEITSFSGRVGRTFSKGLVPAVGALGALAYGAHKATDAASDLAESQNAVQVVFGKSSKKIEAFAQVADKKAGLSMRALNELVTPLGASFRNYGDSADEAATKSVKLAQRAADMASVFNTSVPEALQAIQAALRGESDPIERFGVGLNETAVNAKAMAMGLAKSTSEISAQDKAQARYALILEQTNRLQGDFARTSGGAANSARINAAAAENLQAKLGTGLLPVVQRFQQVMGLVLDHMAKHPGTVMVLAAALGVLALAIIAVNVAMALAASPIYLVILALVALGAGLALAWQKSETFRQIVMAAFEAIRGVAVPVIQWLRANVPAAWAEIQARSQAIWSAVVAFVQSVWARIRGVVTAALGAIKGIVQADLQIIKGIINLVLSLIRGDWTGAWNAIKAITSGALNAVVALIRGFVSVALAAAKALGKAILDGIIAGVKALASRLEAALHAGMAALVSIAGYAGRLALNIGRAIIDGIISGTAGLAGRLYSAVKGAVGSALGKVGGFLGINSPSKLFRDEVGKPIAEGIIVGVVKDLKAMPDLMERELQKSVNAGVKIAAGAKAIGEKFGDQMGKGLLSKPDSLLSPFQDAKYAVDDWAGSEGEDNMHGVGVALASSLKAGFAGKALLTGAMQGMAGKEALTSATTAVGPSLASQAGEGGGGDVYLDGYKVGRVLRSQLYQTKRQTGGLQFEAS